jgi:hypothetical protein
VTSLSLGNICGTCSFLYSRLLDVEPPISSYELSHMLEAGLEEVPALVIEAVSALLPSGEYVVALVPIAPRLVQPDEFKDGLHAVGYGNLAIPHYMGGLRSVDENGLVAEVVIPLFSLGTLNSEVCRSYSRRMREGLRPTAVALSIVEARHTMAGDAYLAPDHWTLMHFLVDGHHKVKAASDTGATISLLSFLSMPEIGGVTTHPHSPSMSTFILESMYDADPSALP